MKDNMGSRFEAGLDPEELWKNDFLLVFITSYPSGQDSISNEKTD